MKLSRNKIRKIRKQQHQSVRKWKRQHISSARRNTFRQSRVRRSGSVITKYIPKVVNRTLKKYVSDYEIRELKEKHRKLRRDKRKKRQQVGGAEATLSPELLQAAVTAAGTAAAEIVLKQQQSKQSPSDNSSKDNEVKSNIQTSPITSETTAISNVVPGTESASTPSSESSSDAVAAGDAPAPDATKSDGTKTPPFQLGPEIEGDISIGVEEHECKDKKQVSKLVSFLIEKGLPYYIQIQLKSGDKPLQKNDTNIFDLRRILYGKFAQDIKKIDENKRGLYLEPKNTIGVANSELYGNSEPGIFIYTGEKGQILKDSKDDSIQVRLLQADPDAPPIPSLTDSKRLYKLKGKGTDSKPASIDTMKLLTNLDKANKIDMSEFRIQVAPMTPAELKKDAQNVAAAANGEDPQAKVVVDESNTYIVNLSLGCKVVSIQTLKKSLEKARLSLENEKDPSKQSALDIILMLSSLLQNPEFAKSDGYDDFKESVFGFSYKIGGSERLYGFTQLQTFFDDKKDVIPPRVIKEFLKLLNLLGHGPAGANGDCLRFDGASPSFKVLEKTKTLEKDGKIVTITTETLENTSNMNGFMRQLSKLGELPVEGKDEGKGKGKGDGNEGSSTKAGESAGEGAKKSDESMATTGESPVTSTEASAAAPAAAPTAAPTAATAAASTTSPTAAATTENSNLGPLTKDQIKEVDAIDSRGNPYKAYVIRKFIFDDKSNDLKNINLVHFMGWGTGSDEYIPEPESGKRIFNRGENTTITPMTGQNTSFDDTLDKVMKLYEKEDMAKLEEKARKKAEEYKEEEKDLQYSRKLAAEVAATAAATAAAQLVAKKK